MPSPFAAALSEADRVIDGHLEEDVSIVPMTGGRYGDSVDNERPVIDVKALVDFTEPSAANIEKLEAMVAYEQWEVEIRRALLPEGYRIKKNDEVQLLDRPGAPKTRVMRRNEQDPERLCLTLSPIADVDA